jgi:protein TonB
MSLRSAPPAIKEAAMSMAAVFGPVRSDDGRRWTVSIVVAVALHIAGAALILHLYAASMLAPPAALPTMTFIDLAPLPTPPAPTVAPPPPPEPVAPPEPQQQQEVQPPPVVKPIVPLKHVVPHHVTPKVTAPTVTPPTETTTQAAAPSPMPPAPAAPAVNNAVPSFAALIAARLKQYKRYPALAEKRGERGVAKVRFTLDRGGNVSNAQIESSSGYKDLDDEVLALLRRAAPLPSIPSDIANATLDIHVPVSFGMND